MMAPLDRVRIAVAPSTEMVFSSGRLPLMLKPPLPRSSKPRLLKLPPITPALRLTTPIGLRPENDINSMSLASMVLRTATSVCSGVASAVTEMVSVSPPVSSVTSLVALDEASRVIPVCTHRLKPCSSTESS